MGTGRKIIGWISVLLAMIFSGCVIGWLHCVRPQLFGSAISGRDIAFDLSLIHISEPTRRTPISYAVFCLKKKKKIKNTSLIHI